jgi:phage-related protein
MMLLRIGAVVITAWHPVDGKFGADDEEDWKPMTSIGPGIREIRVRDDTGAFRIIYVA